MPSDVLPEQWAVLRNWLPSDLNALAREHGFMRRARGIQDAELWLRIILMHVAGGLSLEQTAVRAAELGWEKFTAVALFKRLHKAQPWLAALTAQLLREQQQWLRREDVWKGRGPVRLIDATDIQEPGSTGTAWRLHYSLRLPELVCDHFEITDSGEGEKLGRYSFASGELAVVDRGYSNRAGAAHVLASDAHLLARWHPTTFPLEEDNGKAWDPLPWLGRLPARAARGRRVWFTQKGVRYALRLCAVRKGRLAAERAQKKARCKALHAGNAIRPQTIEYARYVMILCSDDSLSDMDALQLYRGRWQIELAFKRLKSLLDAGHVPKSNDASARAWMQAKVLTALLLERTLWESEFFSPWGFRLH